MWTLCRSTPGPGQRNINRDGRHLFPENLLPWQKLQDTLLECQQCLCRLCREAGVPHGDMVCNTRLGMFGLNPPLD